MGELSNHPRVVKDEIIDNERLIVLRRRIPTSNKEEKELPKVTKLSDVMDFLPAGFVYKDETGIGATYLELKAKRNSIIVEPIKITASSKAKSKKHPGLYVGSPTKYHTNKVEKEDILNYVNNPKIEHKKIVVVADSLARVIESIGKDALQDYFLMIDEIDSFQIDSSYRDKMELCIDIYKKFPKDKRAMVSATKIAFSDPELTAEPITHIRYRTPRKRNIHLFYTPKHIKKATALKIIECLKKFPNDKIMVAFNSVSGNYDIAKYLHKHHKVSQEKMRILCSVSNKEKLGNLYAELDSDELPTQITFVTSAYFTGYDLKERYHLITVSSNKKNMFALSELRLKQIAGRCRDEYGLLSETILYDVLPRDTEVKEYSIESLAQIATNEIAALNCIQKNYDKHPLLKQVAEKVKALVAEQTIINGYRFVRKLTSKTPKISYLNIDSYLENQRIKQKLYKEVHMLYDALKEQGHKITAAELHIDDDVEDAKLEQISRSEQVKTVLEKLRSMPKILTPQNMIAVNEKQYSALQIDVIKKLADLHKYIDREKLFKKMLEASYSRDNRIINNLYFGAYFLSLHPDSLYKRTVIHHIKLKEEYTSEELLGKWNLIFVENGLLKKFDKSTKAVRITKIHFKVIKRKGDKAKYYIASDNPYKLELLTHRPINENDIWNFHPSIISELNAPMDNDSPT